MDTQDQLTQVAGVFARLAQDLHAEGSVEETVEAVVQFALGAVGCDHANVVLRHHGDRLEVVAATDSVTRQGVLMQLALGEGPCLTAIRHQVTVSVADTACDPRWPDWARQMAGLGLRSVLSIPLTAGRTIHGALNLVADRPYAFDAEDEAVADILARHASVAVASAREEASLWRAVDARKLIGQAQGILMERFGIDADQAFAILRRYSQDNNRKLRDVAAELVGNRRLPERRRR
ncbi:MAG TPA: GAF and ANTAR domain-containing protein [Kribbella sp.]|nr:GAF and ANTAR domain-containing protein [Kribbella sp.]